MGEPTHVLEIDEGQGEPAFMPFDEGTELAPFTVGRTGSWRLVAAGVRDVHAFVYFDGSALFIQSADEREPVTVDGSAVGKAWTELAPPCHIQMGHARLRYRSLYSEEMPEEMPQPSHPAGGGRPFAPGMFASSSDDEATRVGGAVHASPARRGVPALDDDSTRVGPIDPAVARVIRPAAGMPATGGYPVQGSGGHPIMGSGAGMVPFPHAPPGGFPQPGFAATRGPGAPMHGESPAENGVLAQWNAMPWMRKALLVLAPFCLVSAGYMLLADDDPRTSEAGGAVPSTTAPASASSPAVPLPITTPSVVAPQVAAPPGGGTTAATAVGTATGTTARAPTPNAPTAAAAAPAAPVAAAPELLAPGRKTLERQALDYVAAGDRARAARAYEQLATKDPQNRVWAEALRILRARGDAGTP